MKAEPDQAVLAWLNDANSNELYISAITVAEISYGLTALPKRQIRQTISARFLQFVDHGFSQRTLAFDEASAFGYGDIMATARAQGRRMNIADGQIAAICKTHHMSLATRNTRDFETTGISLINPWVPTLVDVLSAQTVQSSVTLAYSSR